MIRAPVPRNLAARGEPDLAAPLSVLRVISPLLVISPGKAQGGMLEAV